MSMLLCSIVVFAQEIDLKEASKMAQANVKAFQKAGINKVMFVEFFGEFHHLKRNSPWSYGKTLGIWSVCLHNYIPGS